MLALRLTDEDRAADWDALSVGDRETDGDSVPDADRVRDSDAVNDVDCVPRAVTLTLAVVDADLLADTVTERERVPVTHAVLDGVVLAVTDVDAHGDGELTALAVDVALPHELTLDDCEGVGVLHGVALGERVRPRLADTDPDADGELVVETDTVDVSVGDGVAVEQNDDEPLENEERDVVDEGLLVRDAAGEPVLVPSTVDDARDAPVTDPEMVGETDCENEADAHLVASAVDEIVAHVVGLSDAVGEGGVEPLPVRDALAVASPVRDREFEAVEDTDAEVSPVAEAFAERLGVALPDRLAVTVAEPLAVDVVERHVVGVRVVFIDDDAMPERVAAVVVVAHTEEELVPVGDTDAPPLADTDRETVEEP